MKSRLNHSAQFPIWLAASLSVVACDNEFSARDRDGAGMANQGATAGSGGSSGRGGASGAAGSGGVGGANGGNSGTHNESGGSSGRGGSTGASGGTGAESGKGAGGVGGSVGGSGDDGGTGGGTGGSGAQGGSAGSAGSATEGGSGGGQGAQGGDAGQGGSQGGVAGTVAGLGGAGLGGAAGGGRGGAGAGAGGVGGSAGAPTSCLSPLMIDDMEDGDALPCPNQGRTGDWWTATGTATGMISPPTDDDFPAFALGADARTGSQYGMRLAGTGFGNLEADWASLGFNLTDGTAYSLASYTGLAFYAKSKTGTYELNVEFASNLTTPVGEGGTCLDDCNDHYRGVVVLGTSWQAFTVPFADLSQEGWGEKDEDLEHTLFIYFGYLGTDGGPANFEFLVDDVRFY